MLASGRNGALYTGSCEDLAIHVAQHKGRPRRAGGRRTVIGRETIPALAGLSGERRWLTPPP